MANTIPLLVFSMTTVNKENSVIDMTHAHVYVTIIHVCITVKGADRTPISIYIMQVL